MDCAKQANKARVNSANLLRQNSEVNKSLARYKCKRCRKRFKTKGGLNLHVREHQSDLFIIKCPDCTFFTYQKANFAKHAAVKHRKDINGLKMDEEVECTMCEFKCFTDQQLKSHIMRKHTEKVDHPFKCSQCEYSTVEKAALEKHIKIVHKMERSFKCEICGFRSQTSSGLARHNRSHLEMKPHQCHLCHMSYADKKRLRDHLLKHEGVKPFACPNCTYTTNRKDNLKTHIKRNHMPP